MFPSNPYVPYKLKEIDLSYNSIPVITYDLTFGTGKLEKLNMSHNAIADIRKGKKMEFRGRFQGITSVSWVLLESV